MVDPARQVFDCVDQAGQSLTLAPSATLELECYAPREWEGFLKECRRGVILPLTPCIYQLDKNAFRCGITGLSSFALTWQNVDNYFCVNARDRSRIEDRCKS